MIEHTARPIDRGRQPATGSDSRASAAWPVEAGSPIAHWPSSLRRLRFMVVPILLSTSSHALACNEDNRLTDYMEEWLASNDGTRSAVVDELNDDLKKGGFRIEGLKSKYMSFFGQRSGPIGELTKCGDDKIIYALDAAIKRTN